MSCELDDSTAEALERRWFAAQKAYTAMRAECEAAREVADHARHVLLRAEARLQALADLLERLAAAIAELDAARDGARPREPIATEPARRKVMSAA